jgi:hypothetical protein
MSGQLGQNRGSSLSSIISANIQPNFIIFFWKNSPKIDNIIPEFQLFRCKSRKVIQKKSCNVTFQTPCILYEICQAKCRRRQGTVFHSVYCESREVVWMAQEQRRKCRQHAVLGMTQTFPMKHLYRKSLFCVLSSGPLWWIKKFASISPAGELILMSRSSGLKLISAKVCRCAVQQRPFWIYVHEFLYTPVSNYLDIVHPTLSLTLHSFIDFWNHSPPTSNGAIGLEKMFPRTDFNSKALFFENIYLEKIYLEKIVPRKGALEKMS